MRLRSLTLTGFRSHEHTTVDFPVGLIGIVGPNGGGKSTLFHGVVWGLYGWAPKITNPELLRTGSLRMSVEIEFEHRGNVYSVAREWKAGGRLTSLQFQQASPEPKNLTEPTMALTEHAIADLIGSRHVALATWYAGQDAAADFFDARPSERRDILGESLGLGGQWWAIAKAAKAAFDATKREHEKLEAQAEAIEDTAEVLALATQAFAIAKHGLEAAEASEKAAQIVGEETRARVTAVNQQVAEWKATTGAEVEAGMRNTKAHQRVLQIDEEIKRHATLLEDEAGNIAAVEAHALSMAEYRGQLERYAPLRAAWHEKRHAKDDAVLQAAKRDQRVAHIEHAGANALQQQARIDVDHCPLCKQEINTPEARQHLEDERSQLQAIIDAGARELLQLAPIEIPNDPDPAPEYPHPPASLPAHIIQQQKALANDRLRRDTLQAARAEALKSRLATAAAYEAAVAAVVPAPEWGTLRQDADLAEAAYASARREATGAAVAAGSAEAALRSSREHLERKSRLIQQAAGVASRLELDRLVAECAAPSGARQLVLDAAIPAIEAAANDLLATLRPGTTFHLETQRVDSERETLDIRVMDEDGYRRVETLSGGEKTRIMLATRWAFSIAAADAHGLAGLPMFVLDEAFGDQDHETGRAALVHGLSELSKRVDQVILVTHDVSLAESIGQVLRVERHGTQSRAVWQ